MKIVVTGGTGFLGVALARRLLARGSLAGPSGAREPIDAIVLFDSKTPVERPAGLDERVELVVGDVSDRERVASVVDRDDLSLFHLASIVSAGAERDFDLALRVNLDGARSVLDACRGRASRPRLVVASSYAVFGGSAMPETVSDTTKLTPQTTYGITKAISELLVNDYTRKGFLDGRSARLPTVIVRPGSPNPAASSWVSGVVREPLNGEPCSLPVGLETRVPLAGVRTVVENLIRLQELDGAELGDDRALTFPSLSVTARELVASLRRVARTTALGPIEVRPDPAIEAIYETWAKRASFARALELGLEPDRDLEGIIEAYVEDSLGG